MATALRRAFDRSNRRNRLERLAESRHAALIATPATGEVTILEGGNFAVRFPAGIVATDDALTTTRAPSSGGPVPTIEVVDFSTMLQDQPADDFDARFVQAGTDPDFKGNIISGGPYRMASGGGGDVMCALDLELSTSHAVEVAYNNHGSDGSFMGAAVRMSLTGTAVGVYLWNGNLIVSRYNEGAWAGAPYEAELAYASSGVLRLEAVGDTLTVYIDDVEVLSDDYLVEVPTQTRVGMTAVGGSASAMQFASLQAEDLSAAGAATTRDIGVPALAAGQVRRIGWLEAGTVVTINAAGCDLLLDCGVGRYVKIAESA